MTSTLTKSLNIKAGAKAALAVLATPLVPAAFVWLVGATTDASNRVVIETSGTFFALTAEGGATNLRFGWPVWLIVALLVFAWQSGALARLVTKLTRKTPVESNKEPFKTFSTIDRMRMTALVERIDTALFLRVPGRRRKEIKQELEANLTESAAAQGVGPAIAQLGSVRSLTRNYLDTEGRRIDLAMGLTVALAIYALLFIVGLLMSTAFVDGWTAAGGSNFTEKQFLYFTVDANPGKFGIQFNLLAMAPLILTGFIVGSHPWRLLRSR